MRRPARFVEREVPMLNALNEVLRDDFIRDSEAGIGRCNRVIEKAGLPHRLKLPHKAFNRHPILSWEQGDTHRLRRNEVQDH